MKDKELNKQKLTTYVYFIQVSKTVDVVIRSESNLVFAELIE